LSENSAKKKKKKRGGKGCSRVESKEVEKAGEEGNHSGGGAYGIEGGKKQKPVLFKHQQR